MDKLEGTALAVSELDKAIRARVPLIGIQTQEEERVIKAVNALAGTPTVGVSGITEVEKRVVFQWTHTAGIIRLGLLPECPVCGHDTTLEKEGGESVYQCTKCRQQTPTEFPTDTSDPSYAIQDFTEYAIGDGKEASYLERASFLILCDIHRFLMGAEAGGENSTRTMRALRDLAFKLPVTKSHAILVAPHLSGLGDAERHIHRVAWPLPTITELTAMVRAVGAKMSEKVPVDLNGGTEDLATALAALTAAEARRILKLAMVKYRKLDSDMAVDLMAEKAAVLQEAAGLQVTTPRFDLDDVGGLDLLKTELRRLPRLLSREAKLANVRAPRGYLFAGPPGTGKSLAAEAMAAVANVPLLRWSIGASKNKWLGETERQVGEVLAAADAIGRCVLFVDEAEKETSSGGDSEGHEVTESVMGILLTWMQEREGDAIVVFTANHPERLRDELLSRFDERFFIDYPDVEGCRQILKIHLERRGVTLSQDQIVQLADLAQDNELCGREIEHAVEKALRDAFIDGHVLSAPRLAMVIDKTKGLATMPRRKATIDAMRRECLGQFQPAASTAPSGTGATPQDQDDLGLDI